MDHDALWLAFRDPPDEARPRVWWHWMDGNIDAEGIRLDLEWLHRVGVRGVQVFDGGMGTPLLVPERVRHGSVAWKDAVRLAVTTARRLGLEFTVASSAGWSAAGGPWVEPVDAMKKVVWSETVVDGGRTVEQSLRPLPDVAGPYQDCPRWGAGATSDPFVQDWLVLAVPPDPAHDVLTPTAVEGSAPVVEWSCLVDGSFATAVSLPRDPDGPSTAWLEQVFDEPVRVSSVTIGLPGPRGFGAAPPPDAVLQASDDGRTYRQVVQLPDAGSAAKGVPVRTASFPPVRARRFRLVLSGRGAADALPPLAPGVQLPPILRRMSEFLVTEFALRPGGLVHRAEVKAGFAAAPDYYAADTPAEAGATPIDPDDVVDLTGHLDHHGVLRWEAPAGRWRILRLGASLTGQTNGPAPAGATGLEVDKLDAVKVRRYLDHFLGLFDDALAVDPGARLDGLLSDSIESGPQNYSDRLRERFTELRGYDPLPWLPALAGYVVGDAARSDRFLWDYRRTLAELLASEYYGTLAAEAHSRGLTYYAEALEDHRPQLGDDLAMRARADVPMGAMWTFDAGDRPKPTYVADLKGASSVAHVYRKPFTGAESMSAFHRPWSYTPRRLKHVADLELALGVTRFCIHTSPHQPTAAPLPGIGLSPYLGQTFIRSEPWAKMAGPWIDYLARCSYLLNQGDPAGDVAVFVGEEGPLTALFGDAPDDSVPADVDHDYVDLEALERRVTVTDGVLAAGRSRYRVLYLGGSSTRMTVRALRRITELVEAGATVVGRRPVGSPSLADDDEEHAHLRDRLWAPRAGGRGRVVDTSDLATALRDLGVLPTFAVDGPDVHRIARRIGPSEVLFLANPAPEPVTVTVRTHLGGPLVVWDPVSLQRRAPALVASEHQGRRSYRVTLPACGSVFLVEGGPAPASDEPVGQVALEGPWRVDLPGVGRIDLPTGPRPWTELGRRAAGFSGVGTYVVEVDLDSGVIGDRSVVLAAGDVGDVARVVVNGVDCGVLWTDPFRLDITAAVRPGRNTVEVAVANAWMNRLIAEATLPTGAVFGPVAGIYAPDAPVSVSGLAGPVRLELTARDGSTGP